MGNNKSNCKKRSTWKHAVLVGLGTFFFAVLITANSQALVSNMKSLPLAFMLLLIIIFIGILFDIIGVAAAAAEESPFHARASRKLMGARQSIWMVRNADKVASFCNDVVGDICGTVSGAIGATIVFSLAKLFNGANVLLLGTIMTGFVAAITVGGKALGKSSAIREANRIILLVGQFLAWIERLSGQKVSTKRIQKGKQ